MGEARVSVARLTLVLACSTFENEAVLFMVLI